MNIFVGLLYNLSLLVSLSLISEYILRRANKGWSNSFLQGILMGGATVIAMTFPLVLSPGLIFDGRSVILSLSGLFFGPTAAFIACLMALALRFYQGGSGVVMGVLVIMMSAVTGTLFHLNVKRREIKITSTLLLLMGLLVHIAMVLLLFILPKEIALNTIREIALPVLITYPITTLLIGWIMADSFEHMRIEAELKAGEEKYRLITENASDVISVYNVTKKKFTYFSPSIFQLRGITEAEALQESLAEALTPESFATLKNAAVGHIHDFKNNPNQVNFYINEVQQPCKDGGTVWVEVSVKYRYNALREIEAVCVSRNITERKKAEENLIHLSYHDYLTVLYNRRFFEEELSRLDTERNLPLSIIMADINGLKLINDSFGHAKGDELLKKAATVIKQGCRADDIIARLGGDEFVILLPHTNSLTAGQVIKRIKSLLLNQKVETIDISVSFGYETKYTVEENIQDILKKAEDHMYRHKLYEGSSLRNKTINLIMNTLFEKSRREMMHSQRVSEICGAIAVHLSLDSETINQIETAGLLHDIGKMGIDEKILNKTERLNEEEWEEIKRHPEIGYRILSSINEFSEIANSIFEHHERWDGKGYPKGLRGEEISFQARIIAVADAYDAMTSERAYRKALRTEEALAEISKNADKQFDPGVVKVFIEKVLGKAQ
jgi:diguanylate cyclase (GGDEF)-like protein/PAS domain S-box-containing protein/putative nucleotidyltransferase with HDIG domain